MLAGKERRRLGRAIPLDPTRIGMPRRRKKEHPLGGKEKHHLLAGQRTPEPNHSTAAHSPRGEGATGEGSGRGVTSFSPSDSVR